MTALGKDLLQLYQKLKQKPERTNLEADWKDISEFIRPGRGDFVGKMEKGRRRSLRRYSDTGVYACENFQAGMYSMGTSKANRWFDMATEQRFEDVDIESARWLEETRDRIDGLMQSPHMQLYRHLKPMYGDWGAFGNGVLFSHEPEPGALIFKSPSVSDLVWSQNARGLIRTVVEEYSLTAKAAFEEFGDDCSLAARWHEKDPFTQIDYLHVVMENEAFNPRLKLDPRGKRYIGYHVSKDKGEICQTVGYHEFPYHIARWSQEPNSHYGRGIGSNVIATVFSENSLEKSLLRATQFAGDPPIAMPSEDTFGGDIQFEPGKFFFGGVSDTGQMLAQPVYTGANLPAAEQKQDRLAARLREMFYFDLMQLAQQPNMTATEVMQRQEEKLRLLGPHLGMLETDVLEPVVRRVAGWALRNGFISPPPLQMIQAGAQVKIEFVSPLAKAQKVADALAIQRGMQGIGLIAQFQPGVVDKFNGDQAAEELWDAFGAPKTVILSDDEVRVIREQRAQQEALAQASAIATEGSQAIKNVADAAKAGAEAQAVG